MANKMNRFISYKEYQEMEEQYSINEIALHFSSDQLTDLQASLYDFQDTLLHKTTLTLDTRAVLSLPKPIKNFYMLLVNKGQQLSQLYSYFWPDKVDKTQTATLKQSFKGFSIQIQLTIDLYSQFVTEQEPIQTLPQKQSAHQQTSVIKQIDEKQYILRLKQRVFRVLEFEQFFKDDEGERKCNYIRKAKNYKNLTTLLVKNSSNILKTLNQSINKQAVLKSYNQIQTNDSTEKEKGEEVSLEGLPSILKMQKINSFQDSQNWSEQFFNIPQKIEENFISKKETSKNNQSNIRQKPRKSFLCKKRTYLKQLQKQTKADLHNQQQTLSIIHKYLQNIPTPKPNPKLLGKPSFKALSSAHPRLTSKY